MRAWIVLVFWGFAYAAWASEAEIVKAVFTKAESSRAATTWEVEVTLKHDDSGWEHFADAWRVVTPKGDILGTRTLLHPHENEQPFTRGDTITIPQDQASVIVEAHDKVSGWARQRLLVNLDKDNGPGYVVHRGK